MDIASIVIILALSAVTVAALAIALMGHRRAAAAARDAAAVAAAAERLTTVQEQVSGQLNALAASTATHQAELGRTLNDRLDQVTKRIGERLENTSEKTTKTLGALHTRLAMIDEARKHLTDLSSQVVGLQDILANKQARGAFGEVQLNDIVVNALPPSAYEFQSTLGNGRRGDCLIRLPNPPGPIVIDAKFPLESYHQLRAAEDDAARAQAERAFTAAIQKHVADIAERYIVPGETADSALMFLPSEAVYAELHANFPAVVERSYRARVWIVSPTTLMATLNTVRAVLKDARMREQAGVIQKQVMDLLDDVGRLDNRVANLQKHFAQAEKDIREIGISSDKIARKASRIEDLQLDDDDDTPVAPPPGLSAPVTH